eukprot:692912-Pyramimonas_sp.AAC.1
MKLCAGAQSVVALSSGETECCGIVMVVSVLLGLLKDFKVDCGLVFNRHSSTSAATASRRWLGQLRHARVCQLWLKRWKARRGYINAIN